MEGFRCGALATAAAGRRPLPERPEAVPLVTRADVFMRDFDPALAARTVGSAAPGSLWAAAGAWDRDRSRSTSDRTFFRPTRSTPDDFLRIEGTRSRVVRGGRLDTPNAHLSATYALSAGRYKRNTNTVSNAMEQTGAAPAGRLARRRHRAGDISVRCNVCFSLRQPREGRVLAGLRMTVPANRLARWPMAQFPQVPAVHRRQKKAARR